jgi:hypothetical protein
MHKLIQKTSQKPNPEKNDTPYVDYKDVISPVKYKLYNHNKQTL